MMKKRLICLLLMLLPIVFLVSCGKEDVNEQEEQQEPEEIGFGDNDIFLQQASSNPHGIAMLHTQKEDLVETFSVSYSASSAPKEIRMTFAVDPSLVEPYNQNNGTEYTLLPESAYTLSVTQATIPAGGAQTDPFEVLFRMSSDLQIGGAYLLPVSVTSQDIKVRDKAGVVYYTVTVTKDMSPVAVSGKVDPCHSFFMIGQGKALLTLNKDSGELARYMYDAENDSLGGKEVLHADWGSAAIYLGMIAPGPDNSLHVVNQYANWIILKLTDNGTNVPPLADYASFITGGCTIFLTCIPGHSDGFLGVDSATGGIRYYQVTSELQLSGVTSYDDKFNYWPYAQRFVFNDDIYGVDTDGILWRHVYDPETHTWAERKQVDKDWGAYIHICQLGENLLVQKSDGSLLRIPFEPDKD